MPNIRFRLTAGHALVATATGHALARDAAITVEDGLIVATDDAPVDAAFDYGPGALLTPGFIDLNALADVDTTILRYDAPQGSRPGWTREYAARATDTLTRDEWLAGASGAFAQLLLSGVTTALPVTSLLHRAWAENGNEFDALADAAETLGLRVCLGPSYRSAVNVSEPDGAPGQMTDEARGHAGLDDAVAFIRRRTGTGLVTGLLVPSTIETCSDELIRSTARWARELDVPFRLHCCQSRAEARLVMARSGTTSLGLLHRLGALSPRALLPHAIDLGGPAAEAGLIEEDMALLAGSGAVVVHCPLVVGRSGRRLASFASFRDRGIRLGIGTDTAPPDMLMNLQIGVATARMGGEADARAGRVGPRDYFDAATIGGADAIGRPDLGRLRPGAAADIVAWDLSDLMAQPVHDPVQALFLAPPGRRARDVFVAGRRVVANGSLAAGNESALTSGMHLAFGKLRDAYQDFSGHHWSDLFPPTYPAAGGARGTTPSPPSHLPPAAT